MRTCSCGNPVTGRQRRCADCRWATNPFNTDARPYGTYTGTRGSYEQWAEAFRERFSTEEARALLGARSPWEILGIEPGASAATIRAAYRARARATHPDLHPECDRAEFQAVQAAYATLRPAVR